MSPSRLLRASDFCREKRPRKQLVQLEILSSRRRRKPCQLDDDEVNVYVSTDLLVTLSLQVGDVAWLKSTSNSLKGVPVVLMVDEEEYNLVNGDYVVRLPPTVAASIGACYFNENDSFWLESYNEALVEADSVTVRPLGRPVPSSWSDIPETVPKLSSDKTRLLTQSSLISVLDDKRGLFVFEVVDIISNEKRVGVAIAMSKTTWTLEAQWVESSVRRLPPLSLATSFSGSTQAQSNEATDSSIPEGKPYHQIEQPPHPSIPEMTNALSIHANAPASQRVLHVQGTDDNHVGVCIQAAADSSGMRYLCIRGLAAHAHASDIPVSTGSQADQLAGCKAALRHAQECAPCVLHLCNMDHEWSRDDESLQQMQQQRLWTVIMDSLCVGQDSPFRNAESLSGFAPAVIVILSTTKPLSAGPLLHNLVFESVTIQPPDERYARFIWNDDSTFDELYASHLEGRSARQVSHLRRYWAHCPCSADRVKTFEAFCKELDSKQRKSTPHIPSVHWQDVGGLAHVRSEVMDAIELPLKHPKLFPNGGRSGILLYGTLLSDTVTICNPFTRESQTDIDSVSQALQVQEKPLLLRPLPQNVVCHFYQSRDLNY